MVEILRQLDAESAAAEAGEYLNTYLLENKKRPVLLMLSGGSALSILDFIGQTALGENLTVSVLDERFSQDHSINNFAQLQKTEFYADALTAEASFFGTLPRDGESKEDLALRWEKNLQNWINENPQGLIVATLGMGKDGHTAGLFPIEDAQEFQKLFESEKLCVAYNVGSQSQFSDRITTTINFFKKIDFGLIYVCGQEKKAKLNEVLAGNGKLNDLPALAWHKIKQAKIFSNIH